MRRCRVRVIIFNRGLTRIEMKMFQECFLEDMLDPDFSKKYSSSPQESSAQHNLHTNSDNNPLKVSFKFIILAATSLEASRGM